MCPFCTSKLHYYALKFNQYNSKSFDQNLEVSDSTNTKLILTILLDIDTKPMVTVFHYYNFLDYLIDLGGFMMILKFFVAIICIYSIYGSYSTYISRKIRKEMIARNHQAKVAQHNN
mgnify:CR=1 FL=1